jgi:predicted transcriptional regulator
MAETQKVTVNLSQEVVDILKELAKRDGTTMTEVLKRAIATQKFLTDQQAEGKKLIIEDPKEHTTRQLVFA